MTSSAEDGSYYAQEQSDALMERFNKTPQGGIYLAFIFILVIFLLFKNTVLALLA
jgi:hypothetical protein